MSDLTTPAAAEPERIDRWARDLCIAAGDDPDERYRSTTTWKQYRVEAERAIMLADKERFRLAQPAPDAMPAQSVSEAGSKLGQQANMPEYYFQKLEASSLSGTNQTFNPSSATPTPVLAPQDGEHPDLSGLRRALKMGAEIVGGFIDPIDLEDEIARLERSK